MALPFLSRLRTSLLPQSAIRSETNDSAVLFCRWNNHSAGRRGAYARLHLLNSAQSHSQPTISPVATRRMAQYQKGNAVSKEAVAPTDRPLLLTFDAFDTLYTPRDTVFDQYSQVAAHHGIDARPADVSVDFRQAFKQMSAQYPNFGKNSRMTPETWWTRVMDGSFPASRYPHLVEETRNAISRELYERFSSSQGHLLFSDVIPLLKLINDPKSAWTPPQTLLGIISNSDPRVRGILESFGIPIRPAISPHSDKQMQHAHMSFATLSYEAWVEKPDPGIFKQALHEAQLALNGFYEAQRHGATDESELGVVAFEFRHMHIGDDLSKDALAATRAGWEGIWLDRSSNNEIRDVLVDAEGKILADPAPDSDSESAQLGETVRITAVNSLAALPRVVA